MRECVLLLGVVGVFFGGVSRGDRDIERDGLCVCLWERVKERERERERERACMLDVLMCFSLFSDPFDNKGEYKTFCTCDCSDRHRKTTLQVRLPPERRFKPATSRSRDAALLLIHSATPPLDQLFWQGGIQCYWIHMHSRHREGERSASEICVGGEGGGGRACVWVLLRVRQREREIELTGGSKHGHDWEDQNGISEIDLPQTPELRARYGSTVPVIVTQFQNSPAIDLMRSSSLCLDTVDCFSWLKLQKLCML